MTSIEDIPIEPDRPPTKWPVGQIVTIVISVLALAVSLFTLWDSHENAKVQNDLQNDLARPLLLVSDSHVTEPKKEGVQKVRVWINIKNTRSQTAFITSYTITVSGVEAADAASVACNADWAGASNTTQPGFSQEIPFDVLPTTIIDIGLTLPATCERLAGRFVYFHMIASYHDDLNHNYVQPIDFMSEVTKETIQIVGEDPVTPRR